MNGWMPSAIDGTEKYPDLRPGLSYNGGTERRHKNPILTLHTTEGYSPTGGRSYYHFTIGVDPDNGQVKTFQWRSVDLGAYGLRDQELHQDFHLDVETNRCGKPHIQVAFAWRSSQIESMPDAMYEAAAEIIVWAHNEYGLPLVAWTGTEDQYFHGGYGYNASQRLTADEWLETRGIGSHRFVPENTHWDVGALDWNKLITMAFDILGDDDVAEPITFRVGESYPEWEPWAWKCYALATGELWSPNLSSSVVVDYFGGDPTQGDTIQQVFEDQLTVVWQTIGWGTTTGAPDSRPALYSLGKEATLFDALFHRVFSWVPETKEVVVLAPADSV